MLTYGRAEVIRILRAPGIGRKLASSGSRRRRGTSSTGFGIYFGATTADDTAGVAIFGVTDLMTVLGIATGASGVVKTGEGLIIIADTGIEGGIDEVDAPAPFPTPKGDVHNTEYKDSKEERGNDGIFDKLNYYLIGYNTPIHHTFVDFKVFL